MNRHCFFSLRISLSVGLVKCIDRAGEVLLIRVRVYLCAAEPFVSEQLLDDPGVGLAH